MRIKQNLKSFIYILLALFLLGLTLTSGRANSSAFASTSGGHSDVLDDLTKDENFNINDYPIIEDDYSIQAIQIAESTSGALYLYTYQPSQYVKPLVATHINMSRSLSVDGTKLYDLVLVSAYDVFVKYLVFGFEVSSGEVRYYNISAISRPFEPGVDDEPAEGQEVSEVSKKVAQIWTVETVGDTVTYTLLTSEVIEITQKIVGYCAYDDGMQLDWGKTDGITKAYFVAFDTDRPIDKLISADLSFYATRIYCKICNNSAHTDHSLLFDFHDPEYIDFGTGVYNNTPLTITYKQKFSNQGGGNWAGRPANTYTWDRIRTTKNFIADSKNKNYQLLNGWEDELNETKWVLNFYEAQDKYKVNNVWLSFVAGLSSIKGVSDGDCELNNVYDVQVLRLEFETDGKTYNLGVVDNKQSGNNGINEPITEEKTFNFFVYLWQCIIKLFKGSASLGEGFIAVVGFILGFVALFVLIKILSLFIRAIAALFKKRDKK